MGPTLRFSGGAERHPLQPVVGRRRLHRRDLRILKKPDDVAVGVFDGCDQPSATDILLSVQNSDP
jgi:hypothetical protein